MSEKSIVAEIARFRRMSVGELREKWIELYGQPSHSRNKDFLFKRCCWRLQEIRLGGLDDATKARLDQLADEYPVFTRARRPSTFDPHQLLSPASEPPTTASRRDNRLPVPGSIISRTWRGRELRVVVHADSFEFEGRRFASLSELTREITGSHWSGPLFWGLRKRKRK